MNAAEVEDTHSKNNEVSWCWGIKQSLQIRHLAPRHLVVGAEDVALGAVFAELLQLVVLEVWEQATGVRGVEVIHSRSGRSRW